VSACYFDWVTWLLGSNQMAGWFAGQVDRAGHVAGDQPVRPERQIPNQPEPV